MHEPVPCPPDAPRHGRDLAHKSGQVPSVGGGSRRFDQAARRALCFPKPRSRNGELHRGGVPLGTQARELLRRPEGAFGRLEVQADLPLEEIHRHRHAFGETCPILVEDQQIINVNDASDSQLLQKPNKRAEKFSANAWGLGHTEADRRPLQALAPDGVPEATVFSLGWGESYRKVAVGEVHEHAEIQRLDGLRDRLDVLHFERPLGLELVQGTIIGAEPKPSVLLGNREYGRFKIPERLTLRPAKALRAQAFPVVGPDGLVGPQDGDPFLGRPPTRAQGTPFRI
jgi:hypothetical protein